MLYVSNRKKICSMLQTCWNDYGSIFVCKNQGSFCECEAFFVRCIPSNLNLDTNFKHRYKQNSQFIFCKHNIEDNITASQNIWNLMRVEQKMTNPFVLFLIQVAIPMCCPIYCKFSSKLLEPSEKCVIIFCLLLHHFCLYFFNSKKKSKKKH